MPNALAKAKTSKKRGRPPKVPSKQAAVPISTPPAIIVVEPNRVIREIASHSSVVVRRLMVSDLVEHEACAMLPRSAAAARAVRNSVEDVGILQPLIVSSDNKVLDGRYRLVAARELGFEQVTAIVYDPPEPIAFVFHCKDAREHLSEHERAVLAVQFQRIRTKQLKAERTRAMNAARFNKTIGKTTASTIAPIASATTTSNEPEAILAEPKPKQDSRKEACERYNVSERTLRSVRRMADKRPALFDQVVAGKITAIAAIKKAGKNAETVRADKAVKTFVRPQDIGDDTIENRIHVGDAAEVLRRVPDGLASLVLFSPPYPFVKNDEYDPPLPAVSYEQYLIDLRVVLEQSLRVSRSGGRLAIVVDNTRNRHEGPDILLPVAQDLTKLAQTTGWKYLNEIAWTKDQNAGKGHDLRVAWPLLGTVPHAQPRVDFVVLQGHARFKRR